MHIPTDTDIQEMLKENGRRHEVINAPYNPVNGLGCTGERQPVHIEGSPIPSMYLPARMVKDNLFVRRLSRYGMEGYIGRFAKEAGITAESLNLLWVEFVKCRVKYDFEYWVYSFIRIKDKVSPKDIPFLLNRAQRKMLAALESLRIAGSPIKFILLKARQWGGSTLVEMYQLWIMLVHRRNWHTVICGDVESQSRTVRAMLTKALQNYPPI